MQTQQVFQAHCCITAIMWQQISTHAHSGSAWHLLWQGHTGARGAPSLIPAADSHHSLQSQTGYNVAWQPPVYQSSEYTSSWKNSLQSLERNQWRWNNAKQAGGNTLSMNWPQLVHIFLYAFNKQIRHAFTKALYYPFIITSRFFSLWFYFPYNNYINKKYTFIPPDACLTSPFLSGATCSTVKSPWQGK